MSTNVTNKNFKVKNGLDVSGIATFSSDIVLGSAPISFDTQTGRLKVQIDGTWVNLAYSTDVVDTSGQISFMDIGLAIDYDGQPVYTVQANGVVTTATKFADGGTPDTTNFQITFDSSTV
jgi:hypothetical protein